VKAPGKLLILPRGSRLSPAKPLKYIAGLKGAASCTGIFPPQQSARVACRAKTAGFFRLAVTILN
jgi:hypothetical protein